MECALASLPIHHAPAQPQPFPYSPSPSFSTQHVNNQPPTCPALRRKHPLLHSPPLPPPPPPLPPLTCSAIKGSKGRARRVRLSPPPSHASSAGVCHTSSQCSWSPPPTSRWKGRCGEGHNRGGGGWRALCGVHERHMQLRGGCARCCGAAARPTLSEAGACSEACSHACVHRACDAAGMQGMWGVCVCGGGAPVSVRP